jgi:endonuclease/exonuclease/phosphatase family metal-dependent hydrolase
VLNLVKKLTLVSLVVSIAAPASVSSREPSTRSGLSVVTVNMAKETSPERVLREWRAAPSLRDSDIFMLQEVKEENGRSCIAAALGAELGMHVAYSPEGPGIMDRGLAILSRYPLRDVRIRPLKAFDLRFHSRKRFALTATVDTNSGPVSLVNVHLDTRLNTAERLAQLEPVMQDHAAAPARRVIAGDFNSNPFYWIDHVIPVPAVRSQARGVDEFMTRHGFRTAIAESTTTSDFLGMHLDWIWVSGLRAAASQVTPLDFSDHHAVWTRIEF